MQYIHFFDCLRDALLFKLAFLTFPRELRIACTLAHMEREGGIRPRLSPLAQVCSYCHAATDLQFIEIFIEEIAIMLVYHIGFVVVFLTIDKHDIST